MKIVKEMPKTGEFLGAYVYDRSGFIHTDNFRWSDIGVLEYFNTDYTEYYPVGTTQWPELYYIVADSNLEVTK